VRSLAALLLAVVCHAASLTELARGLPAEFAADSLIRIAALEQTPKPEKVDLLRLAYESASGAQYPVKIRPAVIGNSGGPAFLNRASLQDLDGLTLRLRAIEALSPLDPGKARELFQQLPPLELPPGTCAQNQAYDVALFYRVLGKIGSEAAPRFLDRYLAAIASPAQVAPAARMLSQAALADAPFRTAVTAFTAALQKIGPDDRSFTLSSATTGPAILALLDACRARGVPPILVLDAYRAYLVGHLSGERCEDNALTQSNAMNVATGLPAPAIADAGSADAVRFFNEKLRVPPEKPIERYETYAAKTEGSAKPVSGCEDAGCQEVRDGYRRLLFNPVGLAYSTPDRAKQEWRDQLPALLDQLAQWKDSESADPVAAFAAKCGFYSDLAGMVVLPEDRDAIYRAMVEFLRRSPLRSSHRVEWFLPLNVLIARSAMFPAGYGRLIDELAASPDPVIALYAQLEQLAPRPPESIMSLL
jgi:hypothetical protein